MTNTTSRSTASILEKLSGLGIQTESAHIVSPSVAAVNWLRQQGLSRIVLYIGEPTRSMFDEFHVVTSEDAPIDAIIVGDMEDAWTYLLLNRALRQLMQTPPPCFIALGMTHYWCALDGLRLDAGAFVSALQFASGQEPEVLGKPASAFFFSALQQLAVQPEQVVMVGDDLRSDIGGVQQAGLKGLLVRTGKFREADLLPNIRPDGVIDSIASLPQWWSDNA